MLLQKEGQGFLNESRAEFKNLLDQEEYQPRIIFREGADINQLLVSHYLLGQHFQDNDLLADKNLGQHPYLLLIGNSGSGKSLVIAFSYLQALEQVLHNPSAPFPLFLDLGTDLLSDLDIGRALEWKHKGFFQMALAEHPGGVSLFLDSLDDVLSTNHRFINDLIHFLERYNERLVRIVVACRRAAWVSEWFTRDPIRLEVYHADYLDEDTYKQILPDADRHSEFIRECQTLGISSLLDTPFDGFYLARRFRDGKSLPQTRRECLSQRIMDALRGTERDLPTNRPPLDSLRYFARQLACLATFTPHRAWTPYEASDLVAKSRVLPRQAITTADFALLLHRPLFKKTGDRFAFVHQLFQEFLATEILCPLPLRKQRQLLETNRPGYRRIATPFRGIAAFLAEISEPFRNHLFESDPMVLFLAELPNLPATDVDRLLTKVLNLAIETHRPPWWEIPPRGERPVEILSRYHPQNMAEFLLPYLEHTDEIARMWGSACAEEWNGNTSLNQVLSRLAHDQSQHIEIRTSAIAAVSATKQAGAVRALYDMFEDQDDRVRGRVLQAYRQLENPSPREFIEKLRGGSRDRSMTCMLQSEAATFGEQLDLPKLGEAFRVVNEEFEALRDLRANILMGLFRRTTGLQFTDLPPALVVNCWLARDIWDRRTGEGLKQLLARHSDLYKRVWVHVVQHLHDNPNSSDVWELGNRLADNFNDLFLELVPSSALVLNDTQRLLIRNVLARYFYREPTPERLLLLRKHAGSFTQDLQLPELNSAPPDLIAEAQQLRTAVQDVTDPVAQTMRILMAIGQIEGLQPIDHMLTADDTVRVLDRTALPLKDQILSAFKGCVDRTTYVRQQTGPSQYTISLPLWEIPFWVLRKYGQSFPSDKLAQVVCCYGFTDAEQRSRYEDLLEGLRKSDEALWEQCLIKLLESSSSQDAFPYLAKYQVKFYLSRACKRLERGLFDRSDFGSLLGYVKTFQPPELLHSLRRCYNLLKRKLRGASKGGVSANLKDLPNDYQFRPLLLLMKENEDWAWKEFARRLRQEDVLIEDEFFLSRTHLGLPLDRRRLPILGEWYALICRRIAFQSDLARGVLETIVSIGGEDAIRELQRLIDAKAFPDAPWLSHAILKIEDQVMAHTVRWEAGPALDFTNEESIGVILTERDLFEWVQDALARVQNPMEKRGEGVAGFWAGKRPRPEPECQNILWPMLCLAMEKSGIPAVKGEEKFIGPNRCDFWVEYPRPNLHPFRVGVELKVARQTYGPHDLIDPIEFQLWKKYLRPSGSRHGIYIVLWFRDDQRYHGPKHWSSAEMLAIDLKKKCEQVAVTQRISLASCVINVTTDFRTR